MLHTWETAHALVFLDRDRIEPSYAPAAAAAVAAGWLRPLRGRFDPDGPASLEALMPALLDLALQAGRCPGLEGVLTGWSGLALELRSGDERRLVAVAPEPRIRLSLRPGDPADDVPAALADLIPGDRLQVVLDGRGRAAFIGAERDLRALAFDAGSRHAFWTAELGLAEMEERIARRLPIHGLRGMRVLEHGVSGRVTRLQLWDEEAVFELTGLHVRWALGLKENLFDFELDQPAGQPPVYRFGGRGYGHGVGLCQVGAYGMARLGADFVQILHHFYQGVTLDRLGRGTGEERSE